MNDLDDQIRSGLAGGAGPDAPATPPFADVERRARRATRRRRVAAGGAFLASAAAVAGIVALQQPDEDDQTVVVTQPQSSTTTTSTSPETTTTSTTSTTTTTLPAGPPMEIVTYDPSSRQLVVARTATGEVVEVLDTLPEGAQLGSLDVSSDGSILYTTLIDGPQGTVSRVRRGGEPEAGPTGTGVAAGPDGRFVVAHDTYLTVFDDFGAASGTTVFDGRSSGGYRVPHTPAWSPDGRWISAAVADGLLVDDTTLDPGDRTLAPADVDRYWQPVTFDADGMLVVFEHTSCQVLGDETIDPDCIEQPPQVHVVDPSTVEIVATIDLGTDELASDLDMDPTGEWLLATLSTYRSSEGRVRWYHDGRSGIVPGPYASFAVWAPPPPTGG